MTCSKPIIRTVALVGSLLMSAGVARAAITDFTSWRKVTDPSTPYMTSSVDSASQITVSVADHAIGGYTDLGYQSVDGNTAASSTNPENAFSPAASFHLAIDYNVSLVNALGGLAIGFGIGEDINGANSGGVVFFMPNGTPVGSPEDPVFFMAGRINDNNVWPQSVLQAEQLTGSMFVSYDAATGNITGGIGNAGGSAPLYTATLAGIQNSWTDALLFPAFFVRSESFLTGQGWTSGTASIVFSNFRVLPVPEPSSLTLLAWSLLAIPFARHKFAKGH